MVVECSRDLRSASSVGSPEIPPKREPLSWEIQPPWTSRFVIFVRPPSAGMWPQIIWHQINFATILPHLSALLEKLKGWIYLPAHRENDCSVGHGPQ